MNKKIKTDAVDSLFDAVLCLQSREECYSFFEDLCTVNELLSLSQRFEVAAMLKDGKTYLEIAEKTGAEIRLIAFTGVAVLSIHSVGMIGKMYAEQLDVISSEPLEALDAVGATGFTKIQYGVVPQVMPNFLSVILYRFDLNIRTASLLGLVGAGGLGYPILVYSQNEHWPELAAALYGIIILVLLVDTVSSFLRKKLV